MGIASQKLRDIMKESGYSSISIAEAVNRLHSDANIKKHDIDNLIHRPPYKKLQEKNIEKLKLIAEVLDKPITYFLTEDELLGSIVHVNSKASGGSTGYNGEIYRASAQIVEGLLNEFNITITPQIIHEYALETHDAAIKNALDTPKMWDAYARGAIRSSIKAGLLTPQSRP